MTELRIVSESAADHASVGLIVVAGERPYIGLDRVTPAAAALNADIEAGPVIDGEGWLLGRRSSDRHVGGTRRRSDQRGKCDACSNKFFHHATPVVPIRRVCSANICAVTSLPVRNARLRLRQTTTCSICWARSAPASH